MILPIFVYFYSFSPSLRNKSYSPLKLLFTEASTITIEIDTISKTMRCILWAYYKGCDNHGKQESVNSKGLPLLKEDDMCSFLFSGYHFHS